MYSSLFTLHKLGGNADNLRPINLGRSFFIAGNFNFHPINFSDCVGDMSKVNFLLHKILI